MRKRNKDQVFRITGARQGLDEDVRGRQRRYVISMSIRTIAVILAITLWNVMRPVAVVALVLGFVLPYVAVVIANAGRENRPPSPPTFVPAASRLKLTAHSHPAGRDQSSAPRPQPRDSGDTGPAGPTGAAADRSGSPPQDHG